MTQPYRWQDDQPLAGCEFAARLQPGTTVINSMYEDGAPQVINVAAVEIHNDDAVTIHDVSGYAVRTCADMCMEILTPELADLLGFLVMAEQDRHLGDAP